MPNLDGAPALAAARNGALAGLVSSLGFDNPPTLAKLCGWFGLPGLSEEAALDCTRKDRRLHVLSRHGLRTPRFAVAHDLESALRAIDGIGFPVVVKPSDRTGSLGVTKAITRDEARNSVPLALAASRSGCIVIEEFLSGSEHTVAEQTETELCCTSFKGRTWLSM